MSKLPHDQWTANISEAIGNLEALVSSSETAFALYLQKLQRCHPVRPSASSILNNPISELVCDALVAYYDPCGILSALYNLDKSQKFYERNYYSTYCPSFLILISACYSGDIDSVQQVLSDEQALRENCLSENTSFHGLVSSCLRVVSQQNHVHIMQYLLDAGYDVNHIGIGWSTAIQTAAREGSRQIIDLLLRPESGLNRSDHQYRLALQAAADHHDPAKRLEIFIQLYQAAEDLNQRRREALLYRACCNGDMALARWLIADGPADIYCTWGGVPRMTYSMLYRLATEGRIELLQWLLQIQPPRISENSQHRRILGAAMSSAANMNHLDTFLEIGKFFLHRPTRLCTQAAAIEDGLSQLCARFPSLDIPSSLSKEVTPTNHREATVGSAALSNAISKGRSSNVKFLLERGVRTSFKERIDRDYYEKNRTAFSDIQIMLVNYTNPVFAVLDPVKPGPRYWGDSQ